MSMTVEEIETEVAAGRLRMPTYPELIEKMKTVAQEKGEWAGIPVPIGKDYPMTIEPRYPYRLDEIHSESAADVDEAEQECWKSVNNWNDARKGLEVIIQKNSTTGKARLAFAGGGHGWKAGHMIGTLGVVAAWLPAAETKAMTKLWSMVGTHKFHCYTLTGTFLESSKRSGVVYLFRRLRPTLALRPYKGDMRVLCGLCLHPIGYYHNAWGGAMVPTDEVIAHLAMMRGDERKFWANANQHPPESPTCGI